MAGFLRHFASCRGSRSLLNSARAAVCNGSLARGFAGDADLKKTALYDVHVEHGAKMVPFAGWAMPVLYEDSLIESTKHCRESASIFDVSHMCGATFKGPDTVKFLEKLLVADLAEVQNGTGSLSVFTNDQGGIVDDTVLTKVADDEVYLVLNAGCKEKDVAHIGQHLKWFKSEGGNVEMDVHDDRNLLALQGPKAAETLQPLCKGFDLSTFYFSNFKRLDIDGIPAWLTRTGYTGEDGFEISIPADQSKKLVQKLLSNPAVKLAGLGARDSLRLEAGLCLYGNDLNEEISPVQAGLKWTIGKRRQKSCDFLGGEVIKKHLQDGVDVRRIGLTIPKGAPARQHAKIETMDGKEVGEVTSGAFSPCLNKNIAMGYVQKGNQKSGTQLKVVVRGRSNEAEVTKMPFVPTTYHRPS